MCARMWYSPLTICDYFYHLKPESGTQKIRNLDVGEDMPAPEETTSAYFISSITSTVETGPKRYAGTHFCHPLLLMCALGVGEGSLPTVPMSQHQSSSPETKNCLRTQPHTGGAGNGVWFYSVAHKTGPWGLDGFSVGVGLPTGCFPPALSCVVLRMSGHKTRVLKADDHSRVCGQGKRLCATLSSLSLCHIPTPHTVFLNLTTLTHSTKSS